MSTECETRQTAVTSKTSPELALSVLTWSQARLVTAPNAMLSQMRIRA